MNHNVRNDSVIMLISPYNDFGSFFDNLDDTVFVRLRHGLKSVENLTMVAEK